MGLIYLKSNSQRNVPPSSVNIFPSIGAKHSLWCESAQVNRSTNITFFQQPAYQAGKVEQLASHLRSAFKLRDKLRCYALLEVHSSNFLLFHSARCMASQQLPLSLPLQRIASITRRTRGLLSSFTMLTIFTRFTICKFRSFPSVTSLSGLITSTTPSSGFAGPPQLVHLTIVGMTDCELACTNHSREGQNFKTKKWC